MKNFTCLKFLLLTALTFHLKAQPVVLTNHSDLLNRVIGFVDFADCAVDMNGDYLDDVVRVGGKGIYIDFQNADGTFSQKFFNVFVHEFPSWSICAGDLDKNGFNDLLFANSSAVSFVKANDAGTGYAESVMPGVVLSQRSTMADINNDGWLDAFVCNDTALSIPYRNDGFGNMAPDTSLIRTSGRPGAYSAIWTDYDNDNDIDLYITKCEPGSLPGDIDRTNLLYRNNGDGTFSEVGSIAGLDDNAQSWSTSFEDFDNDGDFDAFIVNHDFENRLFRNNDDGTFTDVIQGSGINPLDLGAYENSTGDFNNDGFVDIFSDLTQQLYLSNGDLTFSGQTLPVVLGAIADLNNDGFLDVYHKSKMWINEGNTNHWLKINTLGLISNPNGIGAKVEIYGPWGVQLREVRSGQSYSPMSSLNVHFGLGQFDSVDSVVVKWPSGITTILSDVKADSMYVMPEAECLLTSSLLFINGDTSICQGTLLTANAPNGFQSFNWSNGDTTRTINVSSEGLYFVVLKDSLGCVSVSNSFRVHFLDEQIPIITATTGNHICAGDTITLSSSQGRNYHWSNGINGQQRIPVTRPGNYTVSVDAVCADAQISSEPYPVVILPSPEPIVNDVEIIGGDSILLTAIGENLHWFDQPSGGLLLNTGSSFQTPALNSSTTYYVEAHNFYPGEIQSGGKLDTMGPGGLPSQAGYLLFETWEPFTLLSVTVYVPAGGPGGTRFIQLYSNDSLIAVKQFIVQEGANVLDLNFDVPVGKFSLRCPQGNLFRNTEPLSYPYPIGESGVITTSSFGSDYYYYFYDWKIKTPYYVCISDRVPVVVLITKTLDSFSGKNWQLYPNPADKQVVVELEVPAKGSITLIDAGAKQVLKKDFDNQRFIYIDIAKIPSGIYTLQLLINRRTESQRLIVQ
ncbi:MAG TPA: FG-GAP-like repeat-containing protein [Saprospiraceae bacterium]|nr:FG-GAP-like repeat-containing protein [Saprospiraceae bacterium]